LLLHETTHYLVARIWTDTHSIVSTYERLPIPDRVAFEEPRDLPDFGVRLTAAAPLLWTIIWIPVFIDFVKQPSYSGAVLNSFLLAASIISPHDLLAISNPEGWKTMTESGRDYGTIHVSLVVLGLRQAPWSKQGA